MLASSPRSQVTASPADFAEVEPTRYLSVGGDGIKLYSNMLPSAWFRCDQPASCRRDLRARRRVCGIAKSAWKSLGWRLPIVATHFTFAAVCNVGRIFLAESDHLKQAIQTSRFPVISAENFENTLAICRRTRCTMVGTHSRFTRQG